MGAQAKYPPDLSDILKEADDLLREARQERDSARAENGDLREALRLAHADTAEALLSRIGLFGMPDSERLVVMAQNPNNYHNWSLSVGKFTAGEVRRAIAKATS